ncbi:MAG TPA: DoxX family membrane protein [Candidatus Saccharimonadia bacterium]|jgi:uncharacterized membrane protein YphA (DoxX/SURF4 family)
MAAKVKLAKLILRLGLAAVFLYAAAGSLASPQDWVGYLPAFATNIAPAGILLKIFSAYELLLALWLVSGKYLRYAGILSALTMLGIILTGLKLLAITFRDLAIATAAIALAVLSD